MGVRTKQVGWLRKFGISCTGLSDNVYKPLRYSQDAESALRCPQLDEV